MSYNNNVGRVIYLNHSELALALRLCYRAELMATQAGAFVKLPAIIWGDPGIGKTSVARDLAKWIKDELSEKGLTSGFWSLSLAYKDIVDIGGYGVPDHKTKTMVYFPPEDIPYINRHVKGAQHPYGVMNLDDVDKAPLEVQNGSLSLLLDRTLNNNPISPNVYVCATANGESDPGASSPLGGAFGNRMVHLYLRPDKGWSKFLNSKGIESVEDMLPIKRTEFREVAMCTPRSIEMGKWIMKARRDESKLVLRACLSGCMGDEAGAIVSKVASRSFSLEYIMNGIPIEPTEVSFDDIGMLVIELEKLNKAARPAVKTAVTDWAEQIPDEFKNILIATVNKW